MENKTFGLISIHWIFIIPAIVLNVFPLMIVVCIIAMYLVMCYITYIWVASAEEDKKTFFL